MGRTIIIEERVNEYISSLYGTNQWQLGLIIGQVRILFRTQKLQEQAYRIFSIKRRTPNKRRVQINAGSTGPSLK